MLRISTPYGNTYTVSKEGYINGSTKWIFKGLQHVKKSWFIPFEKITPELLDKLNLTYKNGNPQFTVKDVDHGTTRTWGNTKHHGIKHISFIS